MTKVSQEAHAALRVLSKAHEDEQLSRLRIRAEIEAAYEQKLYDLRLQKSKAARYALEKGATKTAVGRAMGTSSFNTIQALLALSEPVTAYVPQSPYEYDAVSKTLRVHWFEYDWPGREPITGDAEYAVSAWGAEHGDKFAGAVRLVMSGGDPVMEMLQSPRPWGPATELIESVFNENGWDWR